MVKQTTQVQKEGQRNLDWVLYTDGKGCKKNMVDDKISFFV